MLDDDFQPKYSYVIPLIAAFRNLDEAQNYCNYLGINLYDHFEFHYDGPIRITTPSMVYENTFLSRCIFRYRKGSLHYIEVEDQNPTRTSFPINYHGSGRTTIEIVGQAWESEGGSCGGTSLSGSFKSDNTYRSISIGVWPRFGKETSPFTPCPLSDKPLEYPILIG